MSRTSHPSWRIEVGCVVLLYLANSFATSSPIRQTYRKDAHSLISSSMTSHGPPVWLVRSVLICRIPLINVKGMADCVTNAEVTYQFALHPTGLAHLTRLGSRANEPRMASDALSVLTAR